MNIERSIWDKIPEDIVSFDEKSYLTVSPSYGGRRVRLRSRLRQTEAMEDILARVSAMPQIDSELKLSESLAHNQILLQQVFKNCADIVFRPIQANSMVKLLIVYIDGLSDLKILDEAILKPTLFDGLPQGLGPVEKLRQVIEEQLVAVAQTKTVQTLAEAVTSVVNAQILILTDGESQALVAEMKAMATRAIEEPSAELSLRGPREGFTESLRTNTSLIRRKVKSPMLKLEPITLGEVSRTSVEIVYIEGIVNQDVLQEVKKRLNDIQIDGVLESGYIEEFIEDSPFSPFPTVQNTERPDVVVANLLEGKVAILIDGTPFGLLVPLTFWGGVQAAEDYYERFIYTTLIRWLRFGLINIALLLPSIYVALTTFHPQMIPTNLLLSFAAAREPSPFPAVVEALVMEVTFEALREAGVRLPKAVGSAVSIVGALVIGQAAVQAGIISAPMVIVVSITGVASFAIPRYNFGIAYRILRFPVLILAGTLGLFGIMTAVFAILIHLSNLRSFGIPYLSPVAPRAKNNLQDTIMRTPRWMQNTRPALISDESVRVPKAQNRLWQRMWRWGR